MTTRERLDQLAIETAVISELKNYGVATEVIRGWPSKYKVTNETTKKQYFDYDLSLRELQSMMMGFEELKKVSKMNEDSFKHTVHLITGATITVIGETYEDGLEAAGFDARKLQQVIKSVDTEAAPV